MCVCVCAHVKVMSCPVDDIHMSSVCACAHVKVMSRPVDDIHMSSVCVCACEGDVTSSR